MKIEEDKKQIAQFQVSFSGTILIHFSIVWRSAQTGTLSLEYVPHSLPTSGRTCSGSSIDSLPEILLADRVKKLVQEEIARISSMRLDDR